MATKPVFTDGMPGAAIRAALNEWADYMGSAAMPSPSTTSLTVGNGTKTLTVPNDRAYGAGQPVRIARTSDPVVWMDGVVDSYVGDQLTVLVTAHDGSGTYSDWTVSLIAAMGPKGDDGSPVEFQESATHIQWRIVGSGAAWQDLVALDDIEGPTGDTGPVNTLTIGSVQGGAVADANITGTAPNQTLNLTLPKGDAGDEVELQTTATHIQWRYTGGAWQNLVLLSSLKGDKGDAGNEVELQKTVTHIQWRYTGGAWQNLVLLADLKGDKGDAGNDGWSPLTAVVADGSRFVLEITDWTGGVGTKPATGYVGPTGIVATKAEAVDIRGPAGTGDVNSVNSVLPDGNGDVALAIDDIPLLTAALESKVDKVTGYGLSQEDYTTAERSKLSGIAENATANTGTVTSVQADVPTGLQVAGGPVTTSGTLTISYASGYAIPTTAKQGQWDTSYGWGNHASAGYALSANLATVAVSGSYSDLSNTPSIPTIPGVATPSANGLMSSADKAKLNGVAAGATNTAAPVQSNWNASSGLAAILNKPTIPTLAPLADSAAISSLSGSDTVTPGALGTTAASAGTISGGSSPSFNWSAAVNYTMALTGNRTLPNPTNVLPGTTRVIVVSSSTSTTRTLAFGSNFVGDLPTVSVTNTSNMMLFLYAASATKIVVTGVEI